MSTRKQECDDCGQDLTNKTQVYPKEGGMLCENCNWRKGQEEDKANKK